MRSVLFFAGARAVMRQMAAIVTRTGNVFKHVLHVLYVLPRHSHCS